MDWLDANFLDQDMEDIKRNLHKCSYSLPTVPNRIGEALGLLTTMLPQTSTKHQFRNRPVSLGLTPDDFELLRKHCNHPLYEEEQKLLMFRIMRRFMLLMLIPCPKCITINDLINVLEHEFSSGIPAQAPTWYWTSVDSRVNSTQRIGYNFCSNKGCLETEDLDRTFMQCSRCKVPAYCCKECQVMDWKTGHKKKCNNEALYRRQKDSRRVFMEQCMNSGISMNKLDKDCLLFYRGRKKSFNADDVINAIRDDPQGNWNK